MHLICVSVGARFRQLFCKFKIVKGHGSVMEKNTSVRNFFFGYGSGDVTAPDGICVPVSIAILSALLPTALAS
jgi:hypothetical protein